MKKYYISIALLLFVLQFGLSQNPFKGYVITKNGIHLTGAIGDIYHSNVNSQVIFTNDLGTTYSYRPELISGFVFVKEEETVMYESKYDKERWSFLEVLEKGMGINLYKSPDDKIRMYMEDGIIESYNYKSEEFWVEVRGRLPIKINRFNFRKQMRRLLRPLAPGMERKIGSQGYRYKDIERIISECNQKFRPGAKLI